MRPIVTFNGTPLSDSQVDIVRRALLALSAVDTSEDDVEPLFRLLDQVDESKRQLRAAMYYAWCQHEGAKRRFIADGSAASAAQMEVAGEMLTRATALYYAAVEASS